MAHFNFNRHELMSDEMRGCLSAIAAELSLGSPLTNQVYGLFDGYYYKNNSDLLAAEYEAQKINKLVYNSLRLIFSIVETWESKSITETEVHQINLS